MKFSNNQTIFRLTVLAGVVMLTTACASNSELAELQEAHQQAQERIENLEDQVSAATNTANSAQQTADEALEAAGAAQDCCEANTERMDRLFERAVQKN